MESDAGKAQCLLTGESTATGTHRAALDGPVGALGSRCNKTSREAIRRLLVNAVYFHFKFSLNSVYVEP